MTQKTIHIKRLDEGYILTVGGKERAISTNQDLEDRLMFIFKDMTDRATNTGIKSFLIDITVDENMPQISNK